MKIIGITGNSGSGKSTVCTHIANKINAQVIDADKIAKELSKKGGIYFESIVAQFGEDVLNKKGELDRRKLADMIYKDDKKKEELNQLTFIYVVEEIKRRINKIENKFILLDAPLLFESNLDQVCDFTIAVIASEDIKIERICKRDNISKEKAKLRLNIQNSNEYFTENADYVITNNTEDIEDVDEQISKIKF